MTWCVSWQCVERGQSTRSETERRSREDFFVPCWSSWNVKRNTLWLIYNEKIFRKLFIGVVVIATFYFMDQPNKIHLLRSAPWSFVPIVVSLFLIELITHQDLVIIMCIIIQMYDREAERLKVMEKRPLSYEEWLPCSLIVLLTDD